MASRGGLVGELAEFFGTALVKAAAKSAKRHVKDNIVAPEIAYWRNIVVFGVGHHRHTGSYRVFHL